MAQQNATTASISLAPIVSPLLAWYEVVQRDLPWRHQPTPYQVWISEIMLQQTRVEAVREYYVRWMEALPTIQAVAEADMNLLYKLWEGLGYYSRVRSLHQAAQLVAKMGCLPGDYDSLVKLPGIGPYTAGAIRSIAFGLPTPAVDGNVLRVIARLTADETDILSTVAKKRAWELLAPIIPQDNASAFTQAMFELGALCCVPTNPTCPVCPLASLCKAFKEGKTGSIPIRLVKTTRKTLPITVLVVQTPQGYLIQPPADKGLLSGLYRLPYLDGHIDEDAAMAWVKEQELSPTSIHSLPSAKHIFTHITWQMKGYYIVATGESVLPTLNTDNRASIALPSAFAPYLAHLSL